MKIDLVAPVRLAMLVLFLLGTRGTPFFWFGMYLVFKEVHFWLGLI